MKTPTCLGLLYLVAFLASIGATLLTLGFFYFTASLWGWDAKLNLQLAAAQSVAYTISALLAHGISARLGRRKALAILYSLLTVACAIAAMTTSHLAIGMWLLVYMFLIGMTWPMLESLCSASRDAHQMSRRVGTYNLTWAIAGAVALILTGLIIEHWPAGIFVLPMILHGACALIMLLLTLRDPVSETESSAAHIEPEPDLLRSRKLALWLSRIALPAMYVVNFAMGAILPSLPVLRHFSPAGQTMCGSIWVLARMVGFAALGATAFWHTRPRLLLIASAALLIAFLVVTLAPSQLIGPGVSLRTDLIAMIAGQVLLGIAMAMIYTASLYFGMVLSQGSTEHGGYHEALIGLGGVLGPGAGALTQYFWPGDVRMAVAAVGAVVGMSVIAAGIASIMFGGDRNSFSPRPQAG